jgi:hypothetical protein
VDGTAQNKLVGGVEAATPKAENIFDQFRRVMSAEFFDRLRTDLGVVENSGIYTMPVTAWLMVLQRPSPLGTLEYAVEQLRQGSGRELHRS